MEALKKISLFLKQDERQKLLAQIALIVATLASVLQFIYIRQNSYTLDSVIIPKTMIWEVNKQHIFFAFILTIGNLCGLILFFLQRYLWTVAVILISLIAIRYVYV
ncbi:hypothetical protein [Pinibacter soli]|uniref:Uncharacterized protein n=1 Tax=Pinibacter soli TaxID=3044211 RepID=A0ABT6R9P8_9BACT|nr:hypothetical protein [Pinibacter soli]MDI3319287.1 hypothetical protein [Pinibacter soli]